MKKKNEYPRLRVNHIRNKTCVETILPKGGATMVRLEVRKGVFYVGAAYCWKGDTYNKRKGKSIAFGRLMYAVRRLDYLETSQTYDWILPKIGKVDRKLFGDAYLGNKIE